MKKEFNRYGLASWRRLTGALQMSASVGLLLGFKEPWLGQAAAAGLALMMLTGIGVRVKIKDNLFQMLPAIFYLVLNGYLLVAGF